MVISDSLAATFAWWLALMLLGLGAWPFLVRLCRGLPDRGYLLAKAMGWLGIGYVLWLGASTRLLSNRAPDALLLLAALLALGGALAYRWRQELGRLVRARGRLLLLEEALFSGAFFAFVLVRALNPDLWQPWFGGEKMMEIAFLNAITRSVHFPPYDPFFAGGTINYYYYGLYLVDVLIKLTGVVPVVAFNLAVPTFFALTVGMAFSFGHALGARLAGRRGHWLGLAAAAGVALAGNLTVLVQTLAGLVSAGGGQPSTQNLLGALPALVTGLGRFFSGRAQLPPFDYWYQATRVIPYTINEFPFFSFLFADLHPHMMAIPFTIAVLVLVVGVWGTKGGSAKGIWSTKNAKVSTKDAKGREGREDSCALGSSVDSDGALVRPEAMDPPGVPADLAFPPIAPVVRGDGESLPRQDSLGKHATLRDLRPPSRVSCSRVLRESIFPLLLLALLVGALGPMNTWDLPTYLGLVGVVLIYQAAAAGRGWWLGVVEAAAVGALAFSLYLPYYQHYAAPSAEPVYWPNQTGLRYFLVVWGLWLLLLYSWLLVRWWRGPDGAQTVFLLLRGEKAARRRVLLQALGVSLSARAQWRWLLAGAGAALALLALLAGEWVLAVLLPLMALAADLCLRPDAQPAERLAGLLAFTGSAILAVTELFFLSDFMRGSEWQRMNTVFKFGIQAWVLLALAAAAGLPVLWAWLTRSRGEGRRLAWAFAVLFCGVTALAYMPLAVNARVRERFPGGPPPVGTLNGLAYMQTGVYDWPDQQHPIALRYDLEAIQWLLTHVQGNPVIAEAPIGYYREGGDRIAAYTGLPNLVGMHENEQRPAQIVNERTALAESIYRSSDLDETLSILRQLQVRYVYVGQLEEAAYGPDVRYKFDALVSRGDLTVAYQNPAVMIYEVPAG